jgi:hypothetical protein
MSSAPAEAPPVRSTAKSASAASFIVRMFAAILVGSSSVPDLYGPATRIISGPDLDMGVVSSSAG